MTVFEFGQDVHPKDMAAARFLWKLHNELVRTFEQQRKRRGLKQRDIAERTGMDKATISRILRGGGNPTARTIAELFWAMEAEAEIRSFIRENHGVNIAPSGQEQTTEKVHSTSTEFSGWKTNDNEMAIATR